MSELESIAAWWMWAGFIVLVLCVLAIDMLLLGRHGDQKVTLGEALGWSMVWFALAMLFGGLMWGWLDHTAGREVANTKVTEYLTGYLLEKTLAVDNIFVFIMLFSYFAVPPEYQKRVLVYGVLGAIVMRAVLILLGAWLIAQFHWVLYVFGLFLLITGIKMLLFARHDSDLDRNPLLRWLRNHVPLTNDYHGEKFWVKLPSGRHFTPLFLVLVLIEASDLIFAVDSIPAIFAVTQDPFIVFTSNIFAILGLRALYFLLAGMAERFHLLKYGLAVVLIFVGTKMLIVDWINIPVTVSLGIIITVLATSILLSLRASAGKAKSGL